jgi:hypothetical protein
VIDPGLGAHVSVVLQTKVEGSHDDNEFMVRQGHSPSPTVLAKPLLRRSVGSLGARPRRLGAPHRRDGELPAVSLSASYRRECCSAESSAAELLDRAGWWGPSMEVVLPY